MGRPFLRQTQAGASGTLQTIATCMESPLAVCCQFKKETERCSLTLRKAKGTHQIVLVWLRKWIPKCLCWWIMCGNDTGLVALGLGWQDSHWIKIRSLQEKEVIIWYWYVTTFGCFWKWDPALQWLVHGPDHPWPPIPLVLKQEMNS